MKRQIILLAAIIGSLLTSCEKEIIRGEGAIVSEQRNVSNFTKIKTFGSNKVSVKEGATFKVEIKGYGNLFSYFETTVASEVLNLKYKENIKIRNDNVEVHITMPSLNGLWTYGSGDINCSGNFTGNTFFEANIHDSGDIKIQAGESDSFKGVITGSGSIYAFGLSVKNADLYITGSGNQEISVNSRLDGKITGSGNIYYKGDPVVNSKITGSGSILKK